MKSETGDITSKIKCKKQNFFPLHIVYHKNDQLLGWFQKYSHTSQSFILITALKNLDATSVAQLNLVIF